MLVMLQDRKARGRRLETIVASVLHSHCGVTFTSRRKAGMALTQQCWLRMREVETSHGGAIEAKKDENGGVISAPSLAPCLQSGGTLLPVLLLPQPMEHDER